MSKKLFVICRWEIKVAEEKKERNFNVKVNNVSVEVRVISFNERVQLSKFYWWNIKWNTIDETEDLDLFALAMHLHYYPFFFFSLSLSVCECVHISHLWNYYYYYYYFCFPSFRRFSSFICFFCPCRLLFFACFFRITLISNASYFLLSASFCFCFFCNMEAVFGCFHLFVVLKI